MTKTAMIDVGGGFRAIFGCGVMDRMLEDGIDVDMCYGVSAGAANMTSFIARQHGRNHTFYTKYAFRKEYASAESFFKNHNFANLDYIYGTLSNHDGENPLDFAAFDAGLFNFVYFHTQPSRVISLPRITLCMWLAAKVSPKSE